MFRSALIPLCAAALAVAVAGCVSAFQTSSERYRFELVDSQVRARDQNAQLRVRLVHLPNNRPVTGAEIYEQRLGIWMSGYKTVTSQMTAAVGPAEAEGNGVYRLHAELPMAGEWNLSLTAWVPGEALPVRGRAGGRAWSPRTPTGHSPRGVAAGHARTKAASAAASRRRRPGRASEMVTKQGQATFGDTPAKRANPPMLMVAPLL